MQNQERYEQYLLGRPVKRTSVPSYVSSITNVEGSLGAEVDSLLSAGLNNLIDRIQISNPHFAGRAPKKLSDFRTAVRRYAEAIGVK